MYGVAIRWIFMADFREEYIPIPLFCSITPWWWPRQIKFTRSNVHMTSVQETLPSEWCPSGIPTPFPSPLLPKHLHQRSEFWTLSPRKSRLSALEIVLHSGLRFPITVRASNIFHTLFPNISTQYLSSTTFWPFFCLVMIIITQFPTGVLQKRKETHLKRKLLSQEESIFTLPQDLHCFDGKYGSAKKWIMQSEWKWMRA